MNLNISKFRGSATRRQVMADPEDRCRPVSIDHRSPGLTRLHTTSPGTRTTSASDVIAPVPGPILR